MPVITKRGIAVLAVFVSACATVGAPLSPNADAGAFAAAEAIAREAVSSGAIPSVAYAVVQRGGIVHESALGFADTLARRAATPQTPYALASASKPLSATALMTLVEQGRVALDQPALNYLPGATEGQSEYTLRQLLSHTSGLGTYARVYWRDQPLAPRPLVENIAAYGFEAQPHGSVFEYSNLGYGLLGEIIAQQSRMSFAQYLQQAVFAPLGMKSARVQEDYVEPADGARKYAKDGKPLASTYNDTQAAGNVWVSAHDLALFAAFSLGADQPGARPLLSAINRTLMQTPAETQAQHPYYGGAGYGLGWYVKQMGREPVVWHEGGMPGASSIMILLPQRGLAAVVLINASDVNRKAQEIANALLRALAPDYVAPAFEPTEGFAPYAAQPEFTGQWKGYLEMDGERRPWVLDFDGAAGKLRATFPAAGADQRAMTPPVEAYITFINGPLLLATLPGRLPGRDVDQGRQGFVLLRLVARGEELSGMAVAYSGEARLEYLYPFRGRLMRERP